jgi:hypothetical protein
MTFIRNIEKANKGLTYGELLDRYALLEKVQGLAGDKLCFARRKNLMKLRSFERLNSMESRIPISEAYQKYQVEYSEIRLKYLLTDKEGKTVMRDIVQPDGRVEIQPLVDIANPQLIAELESLKKKHTDAIQEREDDLKAYREFLQEEVPLDELPEFHVINISEVFGLNQQQADAVAWFIEE